MPAWGRLERAVFVVSAMAAIAASAIACSGASTTSTRSPCSGMSCAGDAAADALTGDAEGGSSPTIDAGAIMDAGADLETNVDAGTCALALDPGFGNGGIAALTVPPNPGPAAIAVQPDGRILVIGSTTGNATVVARYLTNGAVDTSFGAGGFASLPAVTGSASGSGLAVQPDGKIVVVGFATDAQNAFVWQLVRLDADGSLDTTFGASGLAPAPMTSPVLGTAVALARDGSILAGGVVDAGSGLADFVLAKYGGDGALDTAFGAGGAVTTPFGGATFFPASILVQPDDKVLYGAQTRVARDAGVEHDIAVARYTAAGVLDTTFGANGAQVTSLGPGQYVMAGMVLQSTGAIVVSANAYYASGRFALLRYTPAGALDSTFGSGGIARTDFFGRSQYSIGVSLLPGDALVAAGTVNEPTEAGLARDFGLALYDANGQPDPTHAPGGRAVTFVPAQTYQTAFAQALQPDGKLVVAGKGTRATDSGSASVLDIVRYGCP